MRARPSPRPLSRLRERRGYTAIEVMLSMTVLMIGTAGVMSMQKTSIQSNLDARKLDIANSIAHDWLERLTADAAQWTLPTPTNLANNFTNTKWLSSNPLGTWFLPPLPGNQANAEGNSPAFDILGRDLATTNSANTTFCVHVNISQLAQDAQANPLLLRATVIVFWPKFLAHSGAIPAGFCTQWFDVAAAESNSPGTWHMVYATTAIRKTPL